MKDFAQYVGMVAVAVVIALSVVAIIANGLRKAGAAIEHMREGPSE